MIQRRTSLPFKNAYDISHLRVSATLTRIYKTENWCLSHENLTSKFLPHLGSVTILLQANPQKNKESQLSL